MIYSDFDGIHYSDSWVTRMIRIDKNTRFKSKIHEYFDPIKGDVIALHSIVDHYGYLYKTEEDRKKHFDRNRTLLIDMVNEEPDNIRWAVHLVQEYASGNYNNELIDLCKQSLKRFANRTELHEKIDISTFYIGLLYAYIDLKQYKKAKDECQRAFADKRNMEMCQAALNLISAEIDYKLGNWTQIDKYVKKYFSLEKIE